MAAITSKSGKAMCSTHCLLNADTGLDLDSVALLEQIRTIGKWRLKDYVGVAGGDDMQEIDRALAVSVGLAGRV